MADTLRMGQRDADRGETPERAEERRQPEEPVSHPENKGNRPAGLRLQVFTPPPFDEGPLWGTSAEDDERPEPPPSPPAWHERYRPMIRAAVLAAIGGLLVTVGMIISKVSGTPPAPAASHALGVVTAVASSVSDAASQADAERELPPPEAGPDGTADTATVPSADKTAKPHPAAPPPSASHDTREPPDASPPPAPRDAGPGKTLILTDAPF